MSEVPEKVVDKEEKKEEEKSSVPAVNIAPVIPPVTINMSLPPEEKPAEKIIVVSKDCPVCKELKEQLQKTGMAEKVKIVDVDTPEGRKFVEEKGLKAVPECLIVEGSKSRLCNTEEFGEVIKGEVTKSDLKKEPV